jgi:hypothetical protein
MLKFDPEDVIVPPRKLGKPVVGDPVPAQLIFGQVLDANDRAVG